MSYKNASGAWVIPVNQAKEFESRIDYDKLVKACMAESAVELKPKAKLKKAVKVEPIEEFEIELDVEEPKGFLHRDVKSFFKR